MVFSVSVTVVDINRQIALRRANFNDGRMYRELMEGI